MDSTSPKTNSNEKTKKIKKKTFIRSFNANAEKSHISLSNYKFTKLFQFFAVKDEVTKQYVVLKNVSFFPHI